MANRRVPPNDLCYGLAAHLAKAASLTLPDHARPSRSETATGIVCGVGAALCWAMGFVAARHGVVIGLSPMVIALHRFIWPGLLLFPLVAGGFKDLGGIGWGRGIAITVFGGLPLAMLSYSGFLLVPLGHGTVIQPSCGAVGGLLLARLVLQEPLPPRRIAGAVTIVFGLLVIGAESLRSMGAHGVLGDLVFVTTGCSFAMFSMLLRQWQIGPMRAAAVTSVLSLAGLPVLLFTFDNMLAAGLFENVLQAVVQGAFSGAGATLLFTRAVVLLGAGRAVLFSSLVPGISMLIGYLALGEVPSAFQLAGFAIVIVGFRLAQKP
jgi:drug/metabolite transporter (DMT)-like permease